MKYLVIAAVAAVSTLAVAGPAGAADETTVLVATVTGFNDALNGGKPIAPFLAPSQTVVDEFEPYYWSGPSGAANWGAAFGGYMQKGGISEPLLTLKTPTRVDQDGAHAYMVVPAEFTFKQKGKAMQAVGTFVYTLDKTATGWKIASLAWSGPHATPR